MKVKKIAGISAVALASLVSLPAGAVDCPDGSYNGTADTLEQCNMSDTGNTLMGTASNLLNIVVGVLGLVAVVVIILGGVQFLTSSGDPGKVKKAKDTILYGVIGLVVAILAFAIVNFVLTSVSGAGA